MEAHHSQVTSATSQSSRADICDVLIDSRISLLDDFGSVETQHTKGVLPGETLLEKELVDEIEIKPESTDGFEPGNSRHFGEQNSDDVVITSNLKEPLLPPLPPPVINERTRASSDAVTAESSESVETIDGEAIDSSIHDWPPLLKAKTVKFFSKEARLRINELALEEQNGTKWVTVAKLGNLTACTRFKNEISITWKTGKCDGRITCLARDDGEAELWRQRFLCICADQKWSILSNIHVEEDNDKFSVGDIILFKIKQPAATLQRAFTGSEYDHTAIVIPLAWGVSYWYGSFASEKWALLEATPEGVISCPLSARLAQYRKDSDAKIAVRLLRRKGTDSETESLGLQMLQHFSRCCMGQPYSYKKMFVPIFKPGYHYRPESEEESCEQGYFCSELCAIALSCVGAMDADRMYGPTWYWPKSFITGKEIDQHLNSDFLLTSELEVDVNLETLAD